MSLRDMYDDLDQALAGDEPDYDTEPVAPLGADHADRMLRHVNRLDRELSDAEQVYDAERARLDDWITEKRERIAKQRLWFEQSIEQYHRAVLRVSPKELTIHLPNGTLKSTKQQPEWEIVDEAAFLAWAEKNAPSMINRPEPPAPKPAKNVVKASLKIPGDPTPGEVVAPVMPVELGGEIVPGVQVTIRDRKFVIVPGGDS